MAEVNQRVQHWPYPSERPDASLSIKLWIDGYSETADSPPVRIPATLRSIHSDEIALFDLSPTNQNAMVVPQGVFEVSSLASSLRCKQLHLSALASAPQYYELSLSPSGGQVAYTLATTGSNRSEGPSTRVAPVEGFCSTTAQWQTRMAEEAKQREAFNKRAIRDPKSFSDYSAGERAGAIAVAIPLCILWPPICH